MRLVWHFGDIGDLVGREIAVLEGKGASGKDARNGERQKRAVFGGLVVDNAGVASAFAYCGAATLLAAIVVFARGPKRVE
ncbi:hypothetical protein X768_31410 [Mesorhizobium sp. LSJC265A00]|nr:hypothetical protein X768_31410 [Mesorhizobium sp. LSJC265A00]ESX94534.1 hypothetical protein X754_16985 [Mesorhizobium sp. LNJC403B00]ESY13842.1 hypothetical protein X752_01910 [Mesorhizobium sp. LNJC398B00]ESY24263.1 hypothetical protein X750_05720 [Mesorhizobium sp. LNJC394B00]ESZ45959.1 hypothetical protein X730_21660 [Mesorhizobium sp. L103C565B0]ESZ61989.1 hypothetical protein X729_13520 [Mesorhizobium sp. L103C131B0]ESZ65244.1 hypothetical protein X728_05725 [Mesorhizobium sp. L103C